MQVLTGGDTVGPEADDRPRHRVSRALGIQGWSGGSDESGAERCEKQTLIYLDPWALTRDGLGRWLEDGLPMFDICVLRAPESLGTLTVADDRVRSIVVNAGPERMSPASTVARILTAVLSRLPNAPVILLAHHDDPEAVREAFACGARGYIPTSLAGPVAISAIQLVALGGMFAPPGVFLSQGSPAKETPEIDRPVKGFTQRQSQILDCLRRGMANKMIAHELCMCESTVKVHVRNIMKKLKATNRTEVAYLTRGLFDDAGRPSLCESQRCDHLVRSAP